MKKYEGFITIAALWLAVAVIAFFAKNWALSLYLVFWAIILTVMALPTCFNRPEKSDRRKTS